MSCKCCKKPKKQVGIGIHPHPKSPDYPFYARICVKGKQIWLGYFRCEVKAVEAYNSYIIAKKLDKPLNDYVGCDGCDQCVWDMMEGHGQD